MDFQVEKAIDELQRKAHQLPPILGIPLLHLAVLINRTDGSKHYVWQFLKRQSHNVQRIIMVPALRDLLAE